MLFNWKKGCQQIVTDHFCSQPPCTAPCPPPHPPPCLPPHPLPENLPTDRHRPLLFRAALSDKGTTIIKLHFQHWTSINIDLNAVLSISAGIVSDIGFMPLVSLLYDAQNESSHIMDFGDMDWGHLINIMISYGSSSYHTPRK